MLKHLQSSAEWDEKSLSAKGFTLIELLVVVIILGILAAVAVFAVGNLTDKATTNSCKTELATVKTAVQAYIANSSDGKTKPADATAMLESNGGNLEKLPENYTVSAGVISKKTSAASGCPTP